MIRQNFYYKIRFQLIIHLKKKKMKEALKIGFIVLVTLAVYDLIGKKLVAKISPAATA